MQEKIKDRSVKYHVDLQEKIKERSTNFMLKCRRRSSSVASSTMLTRKRRSSSEASRCIKFQVDMLEKMLRLTPLFFVTVFSSSLDSSLLHSPLLFFFVKLSWSSLGSFLFRWSCWSCWSHWSCWSCWTLLVLLVLLVTLVLLVLLVTLVLLILLNPVGPVGQVGPVGPVGTVGSVDQTNQPSQPDQPANLVQQGQPDQPAATWSSWSCRSCWFCWSNKSTGPTGPTGPTEPTCHKLFRNPRCRCNGFLSVVWVFSFGSTLLLSFVWALLFISLSFELFFPECVARVPVSLGGLGVRLCSPSFAFAVATVRKCPQPLAWGP